MLEIESYLQTQSQLIEQHLECLVPIRRGPYQQLFEAARYALLGGGKRLRPILTLTITEMLGGLVEKALTPACALEMVHTYSLIHDDLPSMDDDDYRRGKLTVHRQYSESLAILTGDFLLTHAFEVLTTVPHLPPDKKVQLISILAKRSGAEGMIGGQVMDMAAEGQRISLDTLRLLHRNKTGALITASVELGAIISDATPLEMELLREFAENLGLAFQIVDDILDVTCSQAKHGRQVASDIMNEKSTYVTLLGIEQAQIYAQRFYAQAISALKPLSRQTSRLISLADYIIRRKH